MSLPIDEQINIYGQNHNSTKKIFKLGNAICTEIAANFILTISIILKNCDI